MPPMTRSMARALAAFRIDEQEAAEALMALRFAVLGTVPEQQRQQPARACKRAADTSRNTAVSHGGYQLRRRG